MRGIEYVVDEQGARRAVVIDLGVHGELWEDLYDSLIAKEREDEPRESVDEVKARIIRCLTIRSPSPAPRARSWKVLTADRQSESCSGLRPS